jgi:hypothetical protein
VRCTPINAAVVSELAKRGANLDAICLDVINPQGIHPKQLSAAATAVNVAAARGELETVELLISLGVKFLWDEVLTLAIRYGHKSFSEMEKFSGRLGRNGGDKR